MSTDELKVYSATVSDEQHWRKDFEKTGLELVRLQLLTTKAALPVDYVRCAHEWIADKEAEKAHTDTTRFRKVLGWIVVGAIAAIIAAAPMFWSTANQSPFPLRCLSGG